MVWHAMSSIKVADGCDRVMAEQITTKNDIVYDTR